jgi:predicted RNA-binding protein with PIN domain
MRYVVDGNNVMGQRVGWHRDRAGARRRLLGELARYTRVTGEAVDVVFDGAPDAGVFDGSRVEGIGVYYAAPGSDADSRIRHLVDAAPDRDALIVITSDRRLADDVRRAGARVERSGAFRRQLDAIVADDLPDHPSS